LNLANHFHRTHKKGSSLSTETFGDPASTSEPENPKGLSTYLSNDVSLSEVLVKTERKFLDHSGRALSGKPRAAGFERMKGSALILERQDEVTYGD